MKRLLISLIAVILLCSMAVGVSADWNNPFKDVKESHWYYDAVKTTVEKGIFNGMTENTFVPNGKMTRAMFMTTLANLVDAEVGEYTGLPFTDVKASHWYAPYVQWAYDNEITKGVAADRFGVNDPVTREQMVTLFYNTAAKFGADTSITSTYKFDKVYDDAKIRDYAVEAMKWAMQNSIISGTGVEGKEIIVDPWGTATRAQAAQIITMYLKFTEKDMPAVTGLTINGNPIESYTIVYGAENPYVYYGTNQGRSAAEALKGYIEATTGFSLDVTDDSQEPEGPEILVGPTNRETMGLVTVDRDGEADESFEITVQGNFVVIAGKYDKNNYDGTEFGVYTFAKEILDIDFYSDDVTVYNTIRGLDIPDGYEYKYSPAFEYRAMYWGPLGRDEFCMGDTYQRGWGFAHTIYQLIGFGDAGSENPCLTDEANLAKIEETFLANITPEHDHFWVGQNDSGSYCNCANCQAVYREEGCRGGTMFRLVNRLAKLAEEHGCGHVEIHTLAYDYTFKPGKTKLEDSVVVYYAPVQSCTGHPYTSKTCKLNKSIEEQFAKWRENCSKMFVWDYSTNFKYSQTPMPITKVLRKNFNWFYENGVVGEFNNATSDEVGKLAALKAYLIAELEWDPAMDEDTYQGKIAGFLDAYYGPGGNRYLGEYIGIIEELSEPNCYGYSAHPNSVISNADAIANNDKICELFDAAEALCENEEQRIRIRKTRVSWTYLYLDALHSTTYEKGTDEDRAYYQSLATELYEEAKDYNLCWSDSGSSGKEMNFNPEKSPIYW